ncbi:MAG: menaquinone biosynthesis family protein [Phycisphaerales bacterium]
MIDLVLAHSPDPDDAFMWWPLTGKFDPDQAGDGPIQPDSPAILSPPALETGRFRFLALPADIEVLNRRAADRGDLDITALSVRAWAGVADRYTITRCGASFGEGYGPKVVARANAPAASDADWLRRPETRIAVPGRRTTAFLVLSLLLGHGAAETRNARFIELPFDQVIPAVARGQADAGLVIHEGQLSFADAGLRLIVDLGEWWRGETGGALPLGVNAIRRDLDARFGAGTLVEVSNLLARSVAHSIERWDESVRYTLPFAAANARRAGGEPPTLDRVDRYCRMYVSALTRDMGETGRSTIEALLSRGADRGLCPKPRRLEVM